MQPDGGPVLTPGLTKHTILLCVGRRDHAMVLQSMLEKRGFEVSYALTLYEALAQIEVVMPHFLLTDTVFKDGDVSRLREKMNENELLRDIPCLAMASDRSEKMIRPIKGFDWVTIMLGAPNPKVILQNLMKLQNSMAGRSPFFLPADQLALPPSAVAKFSADAVGRVEDRIIFRSQTVIDSDTILNCEPRESKHGKVELYQGTNLKGKRYFFNIFPFSQQRGPGRAWMKKLPELELPQENIHFNGRVLFVNDDCFENQNLRSMLLSYGYSVEMVTSNAEAVALLAQKSGEFEAVVLAENTPEDRKSRVGILKSLLAIPGRPGVLFLSAFPGTEVDPSIRFLKYPCGLGQLIEAISAASEKPGSYSALETDDHPDHVKCDLLLNIEFVGLDEIGGVLYSQYPLEPGSLIRIENPRVTELLGGHGELRVTACLRDLSYWDRWQIHFGRLASNTSRMKYWQRLKSQVEAA